MRNTIGIKVTGKDDIVYVPDFLKAGDDLLELVNEVDISLSPNFKPTTRWKLKKLSYSSPALLEAEGLVLEDQPDNRRIIVETVSSGIDTLRTTNERPRGFSDKALDKARELSSITANGLQKIEVITEDIIVEFTLDIMDNVSAILRPGREILGSVEGHLETMNSHDGFKFAIFEPVLLRRIRCELLDKKDAKLKKRVYELYEHNVSVSGLLTTNIRGEVQSAKIQDIIDRDRKPVIKDASEVTGIYDIATDIDPVDYVRSLRG